MTRSADWTSVIEAFTAQRTARPGATAVDGDYGTWSFEQLGTMADAVAAHVRASGELRFGYLGARDPRFLAVVLGVLGSGAAYVPLDPSWPAARIAEVAREASMGGVFVDAGHVATASAAGLCDVVRIDDVTASPAGSVPRLSWSGSAHDLAYIVFTSGSTGRPKGVLTEHVALLNNCLGVAERWELTEDDRVLQFTPLGVDITLEEAFSAWAAGAGVVLMDPAAATDLARFSDFLAGHEVSALDLPTSFWTTWLAAVEAGDVPPPPATVRAVAVGSEEVDSEDIARWHAAAGPHSRVFNMYGSTEQAITSVIHGPLAPGDPIGTGVIGTPLPGVLVYVLDEQLRPVAPGVPGELYVGGLAVARGYAGQPGRTAARFRPDPFAGVPGARMYATGDRAVALTDGSFRFAGRIDGRLKIRGFTVQPHEVETVLTEVAGVERVVVTAETGPDGRDRVVAEIFATVAEDGVEALVRTLAAGIADRLPAPSHPQVYTVHVPGANEPRTLRPMSAPARSGDPGADESPQHLAIAAAVTDLWQELLGPQRIGPHDSFLDLGGNSLMVTQLLTRLRSRLGVELDFARFFEAPTVTAVTTAVLESAVDMTEVTGSAGGGADIVRTTALEGPCWPGQERMWFLQRLAPESAAYNLPLAFEVTGRLDPQALRAAVHTVVTRHEPLRTAIRFDGGSLVQSVRDADVRIEVADGEGSVESELTRPDGFVAGFVARPFALDTGEVFRAAVLNCADDARLLVFVVHHVAFDEWSAGLFAEELTRAYAAAVRGADPELPTLGMRYLDFSTWQSGEEFRRHADQQREFWREYLRGLPATTELPADREPTRQPSGAGAAKAFVIPRTETARLGALAQREGVTRFQALLTLFSVFLARHAGQYDLAVGVPTARREHEKLELLIGLFVNTLPVRAVLDDNPRFAEAVQRISKSMLAAQAAGALPLDEIARAAGAHSAPGRNPVFQTMFLMDEQRIGVQELPGARLRPLEVPARTSTLDLTLILGESDGQLDGRLWYSTDRFDEETADRLVATFLALVRQVVADPDLRVKDLDFVRPQDRALVAGSSRGDEPRPPLAVRIAETARTHPERIAVVDGAQSLTYAQLMRLVDDIRGRLLAAGEAGEFVPLVLPGGVAMLASMIAVNSIGRAFVPIDPEWPAERTTAVLRDLAGPFAVVAESAGDLAGGTRCVRVPSRPLGEHGPTPWQLTADDTGRPMYAIYTSGSTGRPKAAIVPHLGVANRIAWMDREFGEQAAQSVLQTTPPVYDSCVWEYLWPLTHGGRTVLSGPRLQASPDRLAEVIAGNEVRTIDMVPSMLDGLVRHAAGDAAGRAALTSLRVAIVGGEELGRDLARRFDELGLTARLYNLYGPTEASIGSMFHRVRGTDRGRVLIGLPIDNTGAAVLDVRRQVVARNVVGELYLAGDCVGSGYLNNPGQTRRRFVENRFPDVLPGTRLYRTGDLVRMRPSGETEFCGRADDQLKIRGVRVEPGEVAAALESHPGVASAVVISAPRRATSDPAQLRVAALLAAAPPDLAAAALLRVTGSDTSADLLTTTETEG